MNAEIRDGSEQLLANIILPPKTFKSGKEGYWGQQKLTTTDGKYYQVQVQVVEITK